MRAHTGAIILTFAVLGAVAVFVAARLQPETLAALAGVAVGSVASLPTGFLLGKFFAEQTGSGSSLPSGTPTPPTLPLLLPNAVAKPTAQRMFVMIGNEFDED